jgi:hypothetical protein
MLTLVVKCWELPPYPTKYQKLLDEYTLFSNSGRTISAGQSGKNAWFGGSKRVISPQPVAR